MSSAVVMPITGIEMHRITQEGGLAQVKAAGAYWVRRNSLNWAAVEPVEGERNWAAVSDLETELQAASAQGLQVILIVRAAPAWAQKVPGVACGPVHPDKLGAFASFMQDAVERYSAAPYGIKYWELGNEPDVDPVYVKPDGPFGCWGDPNDPQYGGAFYGQMLKTVYPRIKQADPQAQVLVGGLLLDCDPVNPPENPPGSGQFKDCKPSLFLEGILEAGGGDFFDGVSFHAYDFYFGQTGVYGNDNWHSAWNVTGPVLIAKASYLKNLLATTGQPDKFLMNTEVALLCGRDGKEPECQTETFELTKAYYAAQANAAALAEGLQANVWYSYLGWRASGLAERNSGKTLPAYDALRFSASQLQGASYVGPVSAEAGVLGYVFKRDQHTVWLVWSADGNDHALELPKPPTQVFDVFGITIPLSAEIKAGLAPVYLVWAPE